MGGAAELSGKDTFTQVKDLQIKSTVLHLDTHRTRKEINKWILMPEKKSVSEESDKYIAEGKQSDFEANNMIEDKPSNKNSSNTKTNNSRKRKKNSILAELG